MNLLAAIRNQLSKRRYACPTCGECAIDFKGKMSASPGDPGKCPACLSCFYAAGGLAYLLYSTGTYLLFLMALGVSIWIWSLVPVAIFILAWPIVFVFYCARKRLIAVAQK